MALLTKYGTRRKVKTHAPVKRLEYKLRTSLNRKLLGGFWVIINGRKIYMTRSTTRRKKRMN